METIAHGSSNVGRQRAQNEDRMLIDADAGLFIVADGMGDMTQVRSPPPSPSRRRLVLSPNQQSSSIGSGSSRLRLRC